MKRSGLVRFAALALVLILVLCGCEAKGNTPTAPESTAAAEMPMGLEQAEQTASAQTNEPAAQTLPTAQHAAPQEPAQTDEPTQELPEEATGTPNGPICSLRIDCGVLKSHLDELDPWKQALVPENGLILDLDQVPLEEGDTVFTLVRRVLQEENIHFEFSFTGGPETAYLQGVSNLYEFDCGPLSGWEYQVNGQFQGVGCGQYTLCDGDVVAWYYTCDLGADIGNDYQTQW